MYDLVVQYVKPELVVLSFALYFVGIALKKLKYIEDSFIPLILGGFGVLLSLLWVLGTSELVSNLEILIAIFTSIVQGILVAGLSTYVNQLIKQLGKLK